MKKILSLSLLATISLVSSATTVACDWTTPPLTVDQIANVMNHLKETSINSSSGIEKIYNGGVIDKVTFPLPTVEDMKNNNSKTALTHARTFSDSLTNIVANKLTEIVNKGIDFNNKTDNFYSDKNINNARFQSYYFTVQLQNIFANKLQNQTLTQVWVYNKTESFNPFKDFVTKTSDTVQVNGQNPSSDSGADGKYQLLSIGQIWANGFIYNLVNDKVEKNISPILDSSDNTEYYQFRFLISFSPNKNFGDNKTTCFYLDYNFRSE